MKLYPPDWRIRISAGFGAAIAMSLAIFLGPKLGNVGLLPGGALVAVSILVGNILGLLVGRLLFRQPTKQP